MTTKNRVSLMHQISVLYNWATDPRETISALSEKQAGNALVKIQELWEVIDRRQSHRRPHA